MPKVQDQSHPIKIQIYRELGTTYRPFKSVERIKAIDRKKRSRIDPRLVIPGVDSKHLGVWDVSEPPTRTSPSRTTKKSRKSSVPTIPLETQTYSFQSADCPLSESSQAPANQPSTQLSCLEDSLYCVGMPDHTEDLSFPKLEENAHFDPTTVLNNCQQISLYVTHDNFGDQAPSLINEYDYNNLSLQPPVQYCSPGEFHQGAGLNNEIAVHPASSYLDFAGAADGAFYPLSLDVASCSSSCSTSPSLSPMDPFDSFDSNFPLTFDTPPFVDSYDMNSFVEHHWQYDSAPETELSYLPPYDIHQNDTLGIDNIEVGVAGNWASMATDISC